MRDCAKQASVATDTPISNVNVRRDDSSNNGYRFLWDARSRNGRTASGFCEANRNGRIVRFEQDNRGGGGRAGNGGGRWNNGGGGGGGYGQGERITARISGGGGSGKCTFEVEVDGVAEVEVRGDQGYLRTISGNPATWRRLDCNQPLPNNVNVRFKGIDGRGSQNMISNGGRGSAIVRIEDPKNGREGYTGDFIW
jgi:hypothetical protein